MKHILAKKVLFYGVIVTTFWVTILKGATIKGKNTLPLGEHILSFEN